MAEVEVGARLVAHRYVCDEPGCGLEVKAGSFSYASNPPQWPAQCPRGHHVLLMKPYPTSSVKIDPIPEEN